MKIIQRLTLTLVLLLIVVTNNYSQSPIGVVGSGYAMGFDGDDDYVEIASSDDFVPGDGALTVSLWVRFPEVFSGGDFGNQRIIEWFPYGATGTAGLQARYMFILYGSSLTWKVKDDAGLYHDAAMTFGAYESPFDGGWHFLSGVIDVAANKTEMYFDGELISTSLSPISSITAVGLDVPLQIGRGLYVDQPNLDQHFEGDIDEVRIWNYARSEDEIRQDMCRALQGNESGLVAFWNFNQGLGSSLLDMSNNGHEGTINNSPTWKTSGAPLGQVSSYIYTDDWSTTALGLSINSQDSLVVTNVTNAPEGVHVYGIDMEPNSLDSIAMITNNDRYFGVFTSHVNGQDVADYSINYYYNNQPYVNPSNIENVGLYSRLQNDSAMWSVIPSINNIFEEKVSFSSHPNRGEYMLGLVPSGCSLDLGEDQILCSPDTAHLVTSEDWLNISWSTGNASDTLSTLDVITSGTYVAIVTDTLGCTTVDTVLVTIHPSYNYTNPITLCEGDSIYLEGSYQSTTGMYLDSLTTTEGCDSIVLTDLTIVYPSYNSLTFTVCDSYTSPNNITWTTSGIYTDTLINAVGCDSVITYNLTVNYTTYSSQTITACDDYLSPSGNYLWTTTGVKQDTIPNALGCDSVLTIDLTIHPTTYASIDELACDEYISPSGQVWTTSGNYVDTIPNVFGCDSIITIALEVVVTPSPVILTDEFACMRETTFTMEAEDPGGTWSGLGIVDETNGTFDPSSVGIGVYEITYYLDGDCPASSNYHLEVLDCELLWQHFYVPNIFSPNGDNSNDEFFVYGDRIAEMELVIFDRWGEKVFETTDITKGWDGTYHDQPVDPAIFAFQLKGKYISGLEFEKAGYLTLIR